MCIDLVSYLLGKKKGGGTPKLQSKSVTIEDNGTTNIKADTGYDGLSQVNVTTNVPQSGGDIDWTKIGYEKAPEYYSNLINIEKTAVDYSKTIYDNWDNSITNMHEKFQNDNNLKYMPLVDTSNVTDMLRAFKSCANLVEMPLINTSNVTTMYGMFQGCGKLETIPQLDTSKVENMWQMFMTMNNLKNVPVLNTSKVTTMYSMFANNQNLTDVSLDNILQMCINAISYNGTKTLYELGLRSQYYPVSRIEALPHYQDFLDAGWTIGY